MRPAVLPAQSGATSVHILAVGCSFKPSPGGMMRLDTQNAGAPYRSLIGIPNGGVHSALR
jgi:hypothetical protein